MPAGKTNDKEQVVITFYHSLAINLLLKACHKQKKIKNMKLTTKFLLFQFHFIQKKKFLLG